MSQDAFPVETRRHSAAHLMAAAIKDLFPTAQFGVGPATATGFFYDITLPEPLTLEDLPKIEKRMKELRAKKHRFECEELPIADAIAYMERENQPLKVELLKLLRDKGSTAIAKETGDESVVAEGAETVTFYRTGDFVDLCRGPHVDHTGQVGHFKLRSIAGAYWRGDQKNAQLQRIHALGYDTKEELEQRLIQIEEAEKRDHRRLGREMDLFHFQEEAPGAVFWHPKGWTLFQSLIDYMRRRQIEADYEEISTPELMDRSLWERSGHWEKFGENMFTTEEVEDQVFALKPMNCPGGVEVFKHGLRSYRELPLRIAEFGKVHRFESSGALHGLMRVRAFTQDDAHIYCTEEQITSESVEVCRLILDIYKDFGFEDVRVKFSDRPEKRIGSDEVWDKSEAALKAAVEATGLPYTHNPGEGAFYGPKLEFVLRDAIGRDWQCGTLQVDLNLPARLDASYITPEGAKRPPVMLHRALFGSLERFTGILLEHYAGKLPVWLAPVQAVVIPIADRHEDYAVAVRRKLMKADIGSVTGGVRVDADLGSERMQKKIRNAQTQKIPYMLVVGDAEAEAGAVAVRHREHGDMGVFTLDDFVARIAQEQRGRRDLPARETVDA
ncbi:threonine--tRNA ligase [Alkalicaulis satelles]|uniref:Threonine--tRNA ligase n=1 Tax=Alkalicaulis satelles TaxID=2609175 RepID=A0A5M6ZJ19_9PROT|nr:threonine--tRNA ligase [Alkalicaulis satelles]KAA5802221.1 threonine--tRNA ligase [Alkalicaulis satelles]